MALRRYIFCQVYVAFWFKQMEIIKKCKNCNSNFKLSTRRINKQTDKYISVNLNQLKKQKTCSIKCRSLLKIKENINKKNKYITLKDYTIIKTIKGNIKIDTELVSIINKYTWLISKRYVESNLNGKRIYLHRLVINTPEDKITDHINGDRLDNRLENLRICEQKDNCCNNLIRKINKSGYKGVVKTKNNRYFSYISFRKKRYNIGYFITAKEAAMAYNKKAIELHGEFASLNKI